MDYSYFLLKISPLYLYVALGYVAGRYLKADRATIGSVVFYIIAPLVFFTSINKAETDADIILIPLFSFFFNSLMGVIFYKAAQKLWTDHTPNIIGFSAGTANTGFFGLPIAMMLFNQELLGVYISYSVGIVLYENSIGYYLVSREKGNAKAVWSRIAKLPSLWGFFFAVICKYFHYEIPQIFDEALLSIKHTYSTLGMLAIGIGLSTIKHVKIDFKLVSSLILTRMVICPVIFMLLVLGDMHYLHLLDDDVYPVLMLTATAPLATNAVILATFMDISPEKVAMSVVISMIIALFSVPFFINLFILR